MNAYSDDLRERLVQAIEGGAYTQAEAAEVFAVSLSFIEKLLSRWRKTGALSATHQRRGPPRALEPYGNWIRAAVRQQPDATLAELCERLVKAKRVQVHPSQMWRALQILKLPLKKSRFTLANGTRRA